MATELVSVPVCYGVLTFVGDVATCTGQWGYLSPLHLNQGDSLPLIGSVVGIWALAWSFRFIYRKFF